MPTQGLPDPEDAGTAPGVTAAHAGRPEQLAEGSQPSSPALPVSLEAAEAAISGIVNELVGTDVAPDAPLAAQGLDSLAALELRRQLEARISAWKHHLNHYQYQAALVLQAGICMRLRFMHYFYAVV